MRIKYSWLLLVAPMVWAGCKKEYDAEATYAKRSLAQIWAKKETFYAPQASVYIDSIATWRNFIGFSFTSEGDPDKLGFANVYNAGKGTNALYMRNWYAAQTLTSDSGYYNITIPKCFQLIPNGPDATEGTVKVIEQTVTLYRTNKTPFFIKISGSGTYNEISKLLEVEVIFDETNIGGGAAVRRKYKFLP
jgi:hypothetical protein